MRWIAGVADIKRIISDTQNPLLNPTGRTVLFIDEIHRFNKAQQDALLPQVEDGTLILIGATTENPFFEVNKALISRSTVFQMHPLAEADIRQIVQMSLEDQERGLGQYPIRIDQPSLDLICNMSNGDARIALNALELAAVTTPPEADGTILINQAVLEDCMQKRSIAFDHDGESHYDNISAFIKSMRGSDPDATAFYLARALHGGEDIEFLARRILICAAEDVGLANPQMLSLAMAAYQGVMSVGMPEARIILAEAALAIATSPKSNSAIKAIDSAMQDVASRNRRGSVASATHRFRVWQISVTPKDINMLTTIRAISSIRNTFRKKSVEPFTLSPVRMVMRDELRNGSTNAGLIKPLKIKQKAKTRLNSY